jgi:alpha-glucosidase
MMKLAAGVVTVFSLLCLGTGLAARGAETQWTLASPDGRLVTTLALTRPSGVAAYPADKTRLYYRIEQGPEGRRVEVLPWSPLGIVRCDEAFVDSLAFDRQGEIVTIDETYTLIHGKRRQCRSLARQQTFAFKNPRGAVMEVIFRVANDGVAFRYHFPGSTDKPRKVTSELTGFRLPADGRAWLTPYQEATQWAPSYEDYYLEVAVGDEGPRPAGWAFPALFQVAKGSPWVLLTDAAVDGAYCACRLKQAAPDGVYQIRFPDPAEGWHQGDVEPSSKLPWTTPWRVVMVADSLAGIVESTLVTDLNPPSRVEDTSWIRPGRATWSWWSDHDSPQDYSKMVEFIDLAAEMGWEYFLVDANWDLMNNGDVRQLAEYARKKGVGLFLWYNSGGDHNIVTEKPRGCMNATEVRKFEFDLLNKWGVKGVKIDFFQSDKQNLMALYHDILRDAAEKRIMVNFHGCTAPRGWQRTWPNLMSMEAVRGEECYTFAPEYPEKAPQLNTILPFTRNVVGPMDYTPCAFTDDKHPHRTTNAHELALSVVFESALLHLADRVSAYRNLPDAPKAFLRDVPVAWDETRYVDGMPGKSVVLARRKGDAWYVGAINGQNDPLRVSVPLKFLGDGPFTGVLIGDGPNPRSFASRPVEVTSGDVLEMTLLPCGGGVIRLCPKQ